jgi:deferrochelatase/peroxidase EfeB
MSTPDQPKPPLSRRGFLSMMGTAAVATGAGLAAGAPAQALAPTTRPQADAPSQNRIHPLWGDHQAGIVTPAQQHTYFAAFDLTTAKQSDVIEMLRAWTTAAARLTAGQTAQPLSQDVDAPGADTGEALGLSPARLTLTFGFGPGLFQKNGQDRYALGRRRPEALVDLPRFNGDQLVEANTGGDLSVQACADDPQVAFHAVRQLARLAFGVAQLRWAQIGFVPNSPAGQTPRNLMGFKDGTINPSVDDPAAMEKFVWVGAEGPDWMHNGTYLVVRRIRMALEHWDTMKVESQEQIIGRRKYSGAPLGKNDEFEPLALDANDKDGNPIIPDNAHARLAAPETNDGAQILRRPYAYNDGVNFTSERWPPWRQGMEYDAGLFFVSYQRDPRTGFIKIFDQMSKLDMLNQFVTHTGGGLFACPGGVAEGEYIGQRLFQNG